MKSWIYVGIRLIAANAWNAAFMIYVPQCKCAAGWTIATRFQGITATCAVLLTIRYILCVYRKKEPWISRGIYGLLLVNPLITTFVVNHWLIPADAHPDSEIRWL